MPFYRASDDTAIDQAAAAVSTPAEPPVAQDPPVVGPPAGMVAVPVADLARSGPPDSTGRAALVLTGHGHEPLASGQPVAFCPVLVTVPALVRRDGRVLADGWLPDHVRLGLLEPLIGDGVVDNVVAAKGVKPGKRRRVMSLPLTARFTMAMTLLPDQSYVRVMQDVVGLLSGVPWRRDWQVPGSKVLTAWRRRLGEPAMRTLFEQVAGPVVTDPGDDATLCGLLVCAVDGFQTWMPNTRSNRAAFRSSGTSDNKAPFPQLRAVIITTLAGRGILGAAMDASSVGEQTLIRRLVEDQPEVFAAGRVFLFDRNFLGHDLILDIVGCGAHLVMRVKSDVKLHFIRWLPDGSYLAYINAPDRRSVLMLRVVEYDMTLPDGVSEVFCLATTLLDWRAYPAHAVSEAYRQRWTASETTIGENKSTITDAGPSRGPILRSKEPALVRQEFWAWLAATQLVRKSAHAATTTTDGVNTDQVSFTTARHEATRSLTQSLVTATTSPDALAAAAQQAARAALANLVVTDRDRHSPRTQKHRPKFAHTATTTPTTRGPFKVNLSKAPVPVPADTS